MPETYDFSVTIGFRVEADNEHDALQAALNTESSLNDASMRSSHGGRQSVVRVKAPTFSRFRKTGKKLPEYAAVRSGYADTIRRKKLLTPLLSHWLVRVGDKRGKEYLYKVEEPTEPRAIERARLKHVHENHAASYPSLIAVNKVADNA